MSTKYLGTPFDIHTGGVDHIPVHHTNEIAQTENALDVHPWVRIWMHTGWLMFDGEKISKSTGGSVLNLDQMIEQGFEPLVFRYFLLRAHYRQQQTFSDEAMRGAQQSLRRLLRHAAEVRDDPSSRGAGEADALRERFRAALARRPERAARAGGRVGSRAQRGAAAVARSPRCSASSTPCSGSGWPRRASAAAEVDPAIDALVAERDQARAAKNWKRADEIRNTLKDRGIVIEDSPQGSRWRRG